MLLSFATFTKAVSPNTSWWRLEHGGVRGEVSAEEDGVPAPSRCRSGESGGGARWPLDSVWLSFRLGAAVTSAREQS